MSRSYKHLPKGGITTAESDKWAKRKANRKWRRLVRIAIRCWQEIVPLKREVSDVWSFAKDGKRFYGYEDIRNIRK